MQPWRLGIPLMIYFSSDSWTVRTLAQACCPLCCSHTITAPGYGTICCGGTTTATVMGMRIKGFLKKILIQIKKNRDRPCLGPVHIFCFLGIRNQNFSKNSSEVTLKVKRTHKAGVDLDLCYINRAPYQIRGHGKTGTGLR